MTEGIDPQTLQLVQMAALRVPEHRERLESVARKILACQQPRLTAILQKHLQDIGVLDDREKIETRIAMLEKTLEILSRFGGGEGASTLAISNMHRYARLLALAIGALSIAVMLWRFLSSP